MRVGQPPTCSFRRACLGRTFADCCERKAARLLCAATGSSLQFLNVTAPRVICTSTTSTVCRALHLLSPSACCCILELVRRLLGPAFVPLLWPWVSSARPATVRTADGVGVCVWICRSRKSERERASAASRARRESERVSEKTKTTTTCDAVTSQSAGDGTCEKCVCRFVLRVTHATRKKLSTNSTLSFHSQPPSRQ